MALLNLTENAALGGVKIEAQGVLEVDQWWFSAYAFINVVCGKEGSAARKYAQQIFSRLIKDGSEHQTEVSSLWRHLKFPGFGQRGTPCMTIRGLQHPLMILGGKVAAEYHH